MLCASCLKGREREEEESTTSNGRDLPHDSVHPFSTTSKRDRFISIACISLKIVFWPLKVNLNRDQQVHWIVEKIHSSASDRCSVWGGM